MTNGCFVNELGIRAVILDRMLSRMSICPLFTVICELPWGSGLRHTLFIVYVDGLDANFNSHVPSVVKGSMFHLPVLSSYEQEAYVTSRYVDKLPEVW